MKHPDHHQKINKTFATVIFGVFSLCFLTLGLYLIFLRDPQTHTQWQTERAISYIAIATKKKDTSAAQAHIKSAYNNILQALSTSPYDPYLWLRLARIESLLNEPDLKIIQRSTQIAVQLKPSLRTQVQREGFATYGQ